MLSRREMGALCAALLLCFLLSLGAVSYTHLTLPTN